MVYEDLPLEGRVLWPGAVIDEDGNPLDWPGWTQLEDGTWVEGDEFDWVRPSVTVEFFVNPTETLEVDYPPSSPDCVTDPPQPEGGDNPSATPGDLPKTGATGASTIALMGVLLLVIGGAATLVARRRSRGSVG